MKYFCPIIKITLYLYRVRVKVKGLSVLPAALFYFLIFLSNPPRKHLTSNQKPPM